MVVEEKEKVGRKKEEEPCLSNTPTKSPTLQLADVGPLPLLHEGCLQFGAQGHMIQVVQQDAHHMTRQVLQPRHGDHLTELQ